jgi:hypothetical protein
MDGGKRGFNINIFVDTQTGRNSKNWSKIEWEFGIMAIVYVIIYPPSVKSPVNVG